MIRKMRFAVLPLILLAAVLSGCATNLHKPAQLPQASSVRFGRFRTVQIMPVALAPAFAKSSVNERARVKIDSVLTNSLSMIFSDAKILPAGAPATEDTLRIEPLIEEIKFIGGAARFWVGAWAGSSAVLMKVTYRRANGEPIAEPEFYDQASAFSGATSLGATDNLMLTQIANQIGEYTRDNR